MRLDEVEPSPRAVELAGDDGDPRQVEVILRESAEVVRSRPPLVIARTRHGFVCASAGVDASNAKGPGTVILLPLDPDASAAALRDRLAELTGVAPGVIVSDSFGRAWRQGTTDVALGVAGLAALRDLRGSRDAVGYELRSTMIAVADEIAGAAELVMGKSTGVPAAIVRGVDAAGDGSAPRPRDAPRARSLPLSLVAGKPLTAAHGKLRCASRVAAILGTSTNKESISMRKLPVLPRRSRPSLAVSIGVVTAEAVTSKQRRLREPERVQRPSGRAGCTGRARSRSR